MGLSVDQCSASVWFILECLLGQFPSFSHHAIGKKGGLPKILGKLEVIGTWFIFGALGIVSIISPSSKLIIACHCFFGLLILQEIFSQNFKIFLNRMDRFSRFIRPACIEH